VILTNVIFVLLVIAALALVAVPLIRRQGQGRDPARQDALREKAAALQLLVELDHDRQTGKLLPDDYLAQRQKVEAKAIQALKRLDALERTGPGDPLEQLIQSEKARQRREARQ
jgi:hypothetical protein